METPTHTLQQVIDFMYANDHCSRAMGMVIKEIDNGYARVEMTVRKDMMNGLGSIHGGMVFSLADSAFAFASNGQDNTSVALDCSITFSKPAFEGDVLTATGKRKTETRKTGLYDIDVTNQNNELIASFRGTVYKTGKPVVRS